MEVRGVNGNKWRLRHEIIIITKPRTPSLSLLTATTTPQVMSASDESVGVAMLEQWLFLLVITTIVTTATTNNNTNIGDVGVIR